MLMQLEFLLDPGSRKLLVCVLPILAKPATVVPLVLLVIPGRKQDELLQQSIPVPSLRHTACSELIPLP